MEHFSDPETIRKSSLQAAAHLGYRVNLSLPILEYARVRRSSDCVARRVLCLHVTSACAYGFGRRDARSWLEDEGLWNDATTSEKMFVEQERGSTDRFKAQVESAWALAWALGMTARLDFGVACDSRFVTQFPSLKAGENSRSFRAQAKLRADIEILSACDLSYCLNWAIQQAQLDGHQPPGLVPAYVIEERRRALEWLISDEAWDDISLDT